jgi:hypothetical protein
MTQRVEAAVFTSEEALVAAARECRARGIVIVDVHSPHPVHGIDDIVGIRRSRISTVTLVGGVAGLSLGMWFQYWTSATDWPLDVGGKPFDSLPAFMPVAFELTVLFAGLATVAALLIRSRLRPGRTPRLADAGVTDDRFALLVAPKAGDVTSRDLVSLWNRFGAERAFVVEEAS